MRWIWIALASIALALTLAMFTCVDDETRVAEIPTAGHDGIPAFEPVASSTPVTRPDDARGGGGERTRQEPVGPVAPASEDSASSWITRVVDDGTNAPLAGARVWLVPYAKLVDPRWPELGTLVQDPRPLLELERVVGMSGTDGSVELPEPVVASLLAVSTSDRFGAEFVPLLPTRELTNHRPIEVRAYADDSLRIDVVDEFGTPRPFVPVDLVSYPHASSYAAGELVHRALPDPGTTSVVVPLARWRLAGGGRPGLDVHASFSVRTGILLLVNPEIGVDPTHLAGEPLRLVVPPCAPIRVRVQQSDRSPWPAAAIVRAREAQWFGQREARLRDGEVVFDAVPVEPEFRVTIDVLEPAIAPLEACALGPRPPWIASEIVATFDAARATR